MTEAEASAQRIRDLEREVSEWRERAETQIVYHDKRVSDIQAQNVRIADLEREVERLKTAIVDMGGALKLAKVIYADGEADRAKEGEA